MIEWVEGILGWMCRDCGATWSGMMGDNEVPETCPYCEMPEFVVQVFDGPTWVTQVIVQAQTWQEAHKIIQEQYPQLTVSVHSMEVYREAKGGK